MALLQRRGLSLFTVFFLISCGAILLLSTTLGLALYSSYEEDLLRSVESGDRNNLAQIGNYLGELLDSTHLLAASLFLDPELASLFLDKGMSEYLVAGRLNDVKLKTLAYPYLHSVVVYDHLGGSYYTTLTRKRYPTASFPDRELLRLLAAGKDREGLLPRSLSLSNNFTTIRENLLSVVVYRNPATRDSFICLNMNAREVGRRLSLISRDSSVPLNRIFLMDSSGIVLAHSRPDEFGKDLSASPAFGRVLSEAGVSGSYIARESGTRYIVTWLKKDSLSLVRATSYDQATASLAGLRARTALGCAAALLLYLALSYLAQRLAFRPLASLTGKIERLMDAGKRLGEGRNEVELLESAFSSALERVEELAAFKEKSLELLREAFLADLAAGRVGPGALMEERLESFGLARRADRPFRLLGLEAPAGRKEALREALRRLAGEDEPCFELPRGGVALVLDAEGSEARSAALLDGLADGLADAPGDEAGEPAWPGGGVGPALEAALGSEEGDLRGLARAAEELRRIAAYCFFGYPGRLLTREVLGEREGKTDLYPVGLEEKAREALMAHGIDDARRIQEGFLEAISSFSYDNAILALNRWTAGLFDAIGSLEATGIFRFNLQFSETIGSVQDARRLAELGPILGAVLDAVEEAFERSRLSRGGEAARRLKDCIDSSYADPNLSAKLLSAELRLSPAYAGTLFKRAFGASIPQYILATRLERARELIEAGEGSVKDIARAVGIENSRYFYTQYRKKYGVPPGRYLRSSRS
jgi:two-component system, response regulator YesN